MSTYTKPVYMLMTASGAIAKGQVVRITADKTVAVADNTHKPFGIAMSGAANGEPVEVAVAGGAEGRAGGNVSAGASVRPDAGGLLVAATAGAGAGLSIGIAVKGGVANDFIEILIDRHDLST
jgi:hypothetical protein